jgi:hypothetical protein
LGKTTKKTKAAQQEPESIVQKHYEIEPGKGNPTHCIEAEPRLIYDLATLVNVVYQMDIQPTKAGYTPKRLLKKIMPLLNFQQGEQIDENEIDCYVDTLMGILKNLKVIGFAQDEIKEGIIHVVGGSFLATWSRMTLVEQVQTILESWQVNEFEDNVSLYSSYTMTSHYTSNPYASYFSSRYYGYSGRFVQAALCASLLDTLIYAHQPGVWYSLESVFKTIWQILMETDKQTPYGYGYGYNPSLPHRSYENWIKNYGQDYLEMVMGLFKDLGLLDIGYEVGADNIVMVDSIQFRLTEIGQQVIFHKQAEADKIESNTAESQQGKCIIQPNFDIMLMEPDIATIYQLLPFTQVKRVNRVSTFQLTKTSIQRGLEAGCTIEQIIETLTRNSQKEIAQNVLYTLREWGEQYKIIHISPTYVVETPDEAASALLLKNSIFAKTQPRQIAACLFLVSSQVNIQSLRTALDKEGIRLRYHEASI